MPLTEQVIYRFGPFLLDPTERLFSRDGVPLTLTPKVFETLLCLVRNCRHVLSKDELLKQIWPDTFVEEVNLAVNISTLRKVLGESPHESRYIATVPGTGYRFVAEVQEVATEDKQEQSVIAMVSRSGLPGVATRLRRFKHEFEGRRESGSGFRVLIDSTATDRTINWVVRFVLLFLALAAVAGYAWFGQQPGKASAARPPSIAVLPFVDLSPDKSQGYFADGLAEELINELAKVSGLRVVARSSSFQFKGKNEDLRSVGQRLGVTYILEGSVSVEGGHARIMAELSRADDGFELWSETYDRNIDDVFAVQDDIARAATGVLQVRLLDPNGTMRSVYSRTTNAAAYRAYLQGLDFFDSDSGRAELERALTCADQAIRVDPNYASAWALRARVWSKMAALALTNTAEGYGRAREDAEHAIVLDPNLAAGYLALGWIQMSYDWNWGHAEASLKKAAVLEPGSAEVLRYQSWLYLTLGRPDEALELYKKVIVLDPLHARSYADLGYRYYFVGQYQEAEAALQRALELNPRKQQDHLIRGQILLAEGRQQQALIELEQESATVWKLLGEALAYHALGRHHDSDDALEELIAADREDGAYQIAQVYAYRGEADQAFEWLDRAYRQHDVGITCVKFDPLLKNLHQDSRYSELLKKVGLTI